MSKRYFTLGMAGHIDHGKTELTKALTGIDTDRLKEEKERKISIEPGFAPLVDHDDLSVSIIDVPGHEKFIRQMIAGVSGIDLTLLVIAADEGIMPQTAEHMEIISHLNIKNHIIVITKIDKVDNDLMELLLDELKTYFKGTIFSTSPIVKVSSKTGEGISKLNEQIMNKLKDIKPKDRFGFFRMPIDQSYHVHGIGTVVRGTIFEGTVKEHDDLFIMPQRKKVQVKSIEQFGKRVTESFAGNRTALALSHVTVPEVKRGMVLTELKDASTSRLIDIELNISRHLTSSIKQRSPIKLHSGTTEVFGRIIMFDRNEISHTDEVIYAQLELNEPIFFLRNDRFILRRATPVETIGGGKIIDPSSKKHKFGKETVNLLKEKSDLDVKEWLYEEIASHEGIMLSKFKHHSNTLQELLDEKSVIQIEKFIYTQPYLLKTKQDIIKKLEEFHKKHFLLKGINKADLISSLSFDEVRNKALIDYFVKQQDIEQQMHFIYLPHFTPTIPQNLQKYVDQAEERLKHDNVTVKPITHYIENVRGDLHQDLLTFLKENKIIIPLTDDLYVHKDVFNSVIQKLKLNTDNVFTIKDAKEIINVSRKYLIPLLEKLDDLDLTSRDGQVRRWLKKVDH